ncbi:MAG: TonB-dependent receptor [Bacteroidota bacterium]
MHRRIFYFLLLLAICPVLLNAGTKGRIKGKVVDLQTGEALIGANVIVLGTTTGAATDANGEFLLQNLDPGVYTIRASYLGFQSITISNVRVNADLTAYIDFELPSEDIQVGTVEIVAQRPLIQKDNTNAVRITTTEEIDKLPIRGFNNIFALTPGVSLTNDKFHIRGGRDDEVGYYIEGVSVRNPRGGGRAVSIAQDALEEIQVQVGGYSAEFGGANSGIVRTTLKSGGPQFKASFEYITDNVAFQSRESAFEGKKRLGTYYWGYHESSLSIGGPLFTQSVKYFFNFNSNFQLSPSHQEQPAVNLGLVWNEKTPAPQRDTVNFIFNNGAQRKAARQYYTLTGTMNFDFKPILFRLSGSYFIDDNDANATGPYHILNDRPFTYQNRNGSFSLRMTHVLSPKMFYELSAGYVLSNYEQQDKFLKDDFWAYGDSVANAAVGFVWTRSPQDIKRNYRGRFASPRPLSVYDWEFHRTGRVNFTYQKSDTRSLTFSGALNWTPDRVHSIKIGGEYITWTFRSYLPATNLTTQLQLASTLFTNLNNPQGRTEEQIRTQVLRNAGTTAFGYDLFGKEIDGADDKFHAPKKPVFAAAYIQDKIEFEDIILNLGLRYDYFDIDNLKMIDPTRPDLSIVKADNTLIESGWEKVPAFSAVSPRIGISFPVTERTVFHAQYGKFVQQPNLNESYVGYDYLAYQLTTGFFFANMRGLDLRPTRTTNYELGFTQQIADFLSFDITAYYKDIKDLVQMVPQSVDIASGFQNYYVRDNVDFATTKGIEFSVTMRRYQRLAINGNMTLQDARGTGSYPDANRGIVGAPVIAGQPFTPKNISPLEFDRPLIANLNLDYRFGDNDGPAILSNFGVNLLLTYQSGRPFTRGTGNPASVGISQQGSGDARFRTPVEPLGSSSMPAVFNVDVRVDKSFTIYDRLRANVYVSVLNLLNTKNVQNVYLTTGTATDNAYLSNPTTYQEQLRAQGQQYIDMYSLLTLQRNGLFSDMRQVRLGIRLEY